MTTAVVEISAGARRCALKNAMVDSLLVTGNVTDSAKACECPRENHYRWMREDREYAQRVKDAFESLADRLEREAFRRAHDGWKEPKYHAGKVVGHVRKWSDTLLIFLLNGLRPEKYRQNVSVSGHDGGPLFRVVRGIEPGQICGNSPVESQPQLTDGKQEV